MKEFTTDEMLVFLVFFVPGFVASSAYRLLTPSPRAEAAWLVYETLAYSMLSFGLTFWVPLLFLQNRALDTDPGRFALVGIVILVVAPGLLGLAASAARRAGWLAQIASHPTASSWDFFFEARSPSFVIVTRTNGTRVAGYWGPNSFASEGGTLADLYVEQAWHLTETGFASAIEGSKGFHVRLSECRVIEFFEEREGSHEQESTLQAPSTA